MKWTTGENMTVDRLACAWLIKKHIDAAADFVFVPAGDALEVAAHEHAIAFDVEGAELSRAEGKSAFEALVSKYRVKDPAIHRLGQIVHGADIAEGQHERPEAQGLKAIAEGFHHLGFKDRNETVEKAFVVYDALYAYCRTAKRDSHGG
ncbi:MAG: chromate resistance protein [Acidobacteria bacterium]|nr:chromate resistance protein [Acidobacteriota bacterium]